MRPALCAAGLLLAFAARARAQPPREWTEPATGHRVVRLSDEPGSASLYFHHQRPGLTVYLPGNGGLLYAVAMMAAGWDGAPERRAPDFPADGRWSVRWEGLRPAP